MDGALVRVVVNTLQDGEQKKLGLKLTRSKQSAILICADPAGFKMRFNDLDSSMCFQLGDELVAVEIDGNRTYLSAAIDDTALQMECDKLETMVRAAQQVTLLCHRVEVRKPCVARFITNACCHPAVCLL
jgi:hypothetical protein